MAVPTRGDKPIKASIDFVVAHKGHRSGLLFAFRDRQPPMIIVRYEYRVFSVVHSLYSGIPGT